MSFVLVNDGHITHAKGLKENNTFWLAVGILSGYAYAWNITDVPPSDSLVKQEIIVRAPTAENPSTDTLSESLIYSVILCRTMDEQTSFEEGTDFTITGSNLTWLIDNPPSTYRIVYRYQTLMIDSLINEVVRRIATVQEYVIPDENGGIDVGGVKWQISNQPTRHIYLSFVWNEEDLSGYSLNQIALFTNTEGKVDYVTSETLSTEIGALQTIPLSSLDAAVSFVTAGQTVEDGQGTKALITGFNANTNEIDCRISDQPFTVLRSIQILDPGKMYAIENIATEIVSVGKKIVWDLVITC